MRKVIYRLFGLAILVAAGWGGYRVVKQLPQRQETLATAKVQRGDVVIRAFSRGELRAVRSYSITAPNLFGTVQVTRLAPMGAMAKEKDLIVEYDDSERQASLEEDRLSVQSIDESIKQLKAQTGITQSQDAADLLKARYDVRRAELDVQKNPILDAIEGKKNILALDQAKRALAQLEVDIKMRQEQVDSQLAVYQETRNRYMLDVAREMQRIAMTKSLTPISGLVAVKQNRAGMFNFGQQLPDIREGDQLMPGMPVADVLDLSEVEVWTKVGELDRANLKEGQDAVLQLDAVPDKQFRGRIKAMSGTATSDVFSGDPSKKFDVVFSVDMRQLLSSLGMKPGDVEQVMRTAEANAKKGVGSPGGASQGPGGMAGAMAALGGMQGEVPGMPMGMPGGAGAGAGQEARQSVRRGSGQNGGSGRGFANLSEADRTKARELMQKMQNASGEERKKLVEQLTKLTGGRAPEGRTAASTGRGGPSGEAFGSAGAQDRGRMTERSDSAMAGSGRSRNGGGGGAGDVSLEALMRRFGSGEFSEADRQKAELPLPPEEDSQVQVLLRPGLLADVEIVVEKIPNAIHVPRQAVFTKNGKPTVFVQQKNGRFEPREVQLAKQSESMMVLAGGVQPGEIVALSDPTADKSKKDKGDKKSAQGSPAGSMPGGK